MVKHSFSPTTVPAFAASLCFAFGLIIIRCAWSGAWYFVFLIWNLFLAAVPLVVSRLLFHPALKKLPRATPWFILLVWLAFFPNAPYLITDLFHLRHHEFVPLWFDTLLLFSCAWNGLLLGYASLSNVERYLTTKFSAHLVWTIVITAITLSAFGVYLGRYLRWNSWDAATNPLLIISDVVSIVTERATAFDALGFTLGFGIFLTIGYVVYQSLAPATSPRSGTVRRTKEKQPVL